MRIAWGVLAVVLMACTAEGGGGVLAVTNASDAVAYVRFVEDDGSTVTYRADPGAVGRAEAADPGVAPASMAVLTADCRVITRQTDPALGQIVIDGRGATSTAADDPEVLSLPLLPTVDACP